MDFIRNHMQKIPLLIRLFVVFLTFIKDTILKLNFLYLQLRGGFPSIHFSIRIFDASLLHLLYSLMAFHMLTLNHCLPFTTSEFPKYSYFTSCKPYRPYETALIYQKKGANGEVVTKWSINPGAGKLYSEGFPFNVQLL